MLRPLYDIGILWALAGLSNNVTFGRVGSTNYINASLFVLFDSAWLDLLWQAQHAGGWCIKEVFFTQVRAYIFFSGFLLFDWNFSLFCLAWLGLTCFGSRHSRREGGASPKFVWTIRNLQICFLLCITTTQPRL